MSLTNEAATFTKCTYIELKEPNYKLHMRQEGHETRDSELQKPEVRTLTAIEIYEDPFEETLI